MEGKKFKLRIRLRGLNLLVGSAAKSVGAMVEFTAFGSPPDAKPSTASAFWLFLSTTMVFVAVRTHFPRKNIRVYRYTVTCVTRVTTNRVEVHRLSLQHWTIVRTSNIAELEPSDFVCLQPWFLPRFRTHFPKE